MNNKKNQLNYDVVYVRSKKAPFLEIVSFILIPILKRLDSSSILLLTFIILFISPKIKVYFLEDNVRKSKVVSKFEWKKYREFNDIGILGQFSFSSVQKDIYNRIKGKTIAKHDAKSLLNNEINSMDGDSVKNKEFNVVKPLPKLNLNIDHIEKIPIKYQQSIQSKKKNLLLDYEKNKIIILNSIFINFSDLVRVFPIIDNSKAILDIYFGNDHKKAEIANYIQEKENIYAILNTLNKEINSIIRNENYHKLSVTERDKYNNLKSQVTVQNLGHANFGISNDYKFIFIDNLYMSNGFKVIDIDHIKKIIINNERTDSKLILPNIFKLTLDIDDGSRENLLLDKCLVSPQMYNSTLNLENKILELFPNANTETVSLNSIREKNITGVYHQEKTKYNNISSLYPMNNLVDKKLISKKEYISDTLKSNSVNKYKKYSFLVAGPSFYEIKAMVQYAKDNLLFVPFNGMTAEDFKEKGLMENRAIQETNLCECIEQIKLIPEHTNKLGSQAIQVFVKINSHDFMIGYVPSDSKKYVHNILDKIDKYTINGKLLGGVVKFLNNEGNIQGKKLNYGFEVNIEY